MVFRQSLTLLLINFLVLIYPLIVKGQTAQSEPSPSFDSLPLPPTEPEPIPIPEPLPSLDELLPSSDIPTGEIAPPELDTLDTVTVRDYQVLGSTVFTPDELAAATSPYLGEIQFSQLLKARAAITDLYVDAGYVSSGAFLPVDQDIRDGIVEIQVIEGNLEAIEVEGLKHLNSGYVRSRIEIATPAPLNVNRLITALQLLQIDPLIESISANLTEGTQTGSSILELEVTEAKRRQGIITVDNGRSPSVGSFRQQLTVADNNLLGIGDELSLGFSRTAGSYTINTSYELPLSPYNTTLRLDGGFTNSKIISDDFEILDIRSESSNFTVTLRHPLIQRPTEELALSLSFDRRTSSSTFQLPDAEKLPFPSLGAQDGKTRVSALRFEQVWTRRQPTEVLALRSQFSLGLPIFDATQNPSPLPDSEFLSWQGQAQWVKIFDNKHLLVSRLGGQVANQSLPSLEQFRLGGQGSVRGYRQDRETADSGLFASLEYRFPLATIAAWDSTLQLAPFVDYGIGWNQGLREDPDDLLSVGTGLLWQIGDRINARVDVGFPLLNNTSEGSSLQESGVLFTISGEIF